MKKYLPALKTRMFVVLIIYMLQQGYIYIYIMRYVVILVDYKILLLL